MYSDTEDDSSRNKSKRKKNSSHSRYKRERRYENELSLENPPKDIKELIEIARGEVNYVNIDMRILRSITEHLEALDAMSGIEMVKQDIFLQILYYLQKIDNPDDYMHTVLYGPPGSGKTSLAEILAEIYCKLGDRDGIVKKVKRVDLISKWCGETSILTANAIKEALGGVLLIDEAYSIGGTKDKVDTFSRECVNTLNQYLSEYKRSFICIIVGYKDALDDGFFGLNDGLRRRFQWRFNVENQSTDGLCNIFRSQVRRQGWSLDDDANSQLGSLIEKNKAYFVDIGGDTETLFTKCKMVYAQRMFGKEGVRNMVFTAADISGGLEMFMRHKPKQTVSEPPPGLYL